MKDESRSNLTSNLALDEEFDPLEDTDVDEEESEYSEFIGYVGTPDEAPLVETHDERTAEERIDALLVSMAPRRKILLGILDFCREPQPVESVNELIEELQQLNYSVFSGANLCALLEQAGALVKADADGGPAPEEDTEPAVVEIDGVEYLEPKPPVQIYWHTTEEGIAALEADKPLERLMDLLEADAKYAVIYKRILSLCDSEDGTTVSKINEAVDHDPLVQSPRLYAPHFVDKLEKCDALVWKKSWVTTEIGRAGLEKLSDVVDEQMETEAEEA